MRLSCRCGPSATSSADSREKRNLLSRPGGVALTYPFWPLSGDADDGPAASSTGDSCATWSADQIWVAARSADERLAGRAAHALRLDPLVRGRRLEICVQNGVIILFGELESEDACDAAGRRAWDVDGVVDVSNQLTTGECDGPDR